MSLVEAGIFADGIIHIDTDHAPTLALQGAQFTAIGGVILHALASPGTEVQYGHLRPQQGVDARVEAHGAIHMTEAAGGGFRIEVLLGAHRRTLPDLSCRPLTGPIE